MHGINEPKFSSMEEADGACESLPPTNGGEAAPQKRKILSLAMIILTGVAIGVVAVNSSRAKVPPTIKTQSPKAKKAKGKPFDKNASFDSQVGTNAQEMLEDGKHTFRFDTFGDEVFWGCGEGADCGDSVKLHRVIEGSKFGGVGPGVSPRTALALGLKVDVDALPKHVQEDLKHGRVNLDDPAVTLELLKDNAVLGLTGFFNSDGKSLKSLGLQCSVCHSTVDNSLAFGIGHRLDGWANRDLDGGKIIAAELAGPGSGTDLTSFCELLFGTKDKECTPVRTVLNSWGPGKFDVVLILDGKTTNPDQVTDGVHKGPVSGAVLIPNAFGLAGFNQHTWTGAWGTVTYWDALVANLIMFGPKGRFFDPRLNDASKFPIAASHGFADRPHINPEDDLITSKLPALHFYLLALPAPGPTAGKDFDPAAAARGDELFSGKAGCNNCHVEPLWTEPGWNLHKPNDIGIDSFQADRAPDNVYKTMNLNSLFVRENGLFMNPANKGHYYHDARFATLLDVVNHYNVHFGPD